MYMYVQIIPYLELVTLTFLEHEMTFDLWPEIHADVTPILFPYRVLINLVFGHQGLPG